MSEGIGFVCDDCGQPFVVPFAEYEGQFDHPPNVPICDACKERQSSEQETDDAR